MRTKCKRCGQSAECHELSTQGAPFPVCDDCRAKIEDAVQYWQKFHIKEKADGANS